ncbi:Na+/H+ antiporter subunit D, partial [Streptomyces sp. SID12501]|nr:Na+/H+ antiporter subunit D [Streptomyces sp. SID12501]
MTDWSWLVPLPVVLPLSGAGLTLALYRRPRVQRVVSLVTLTLVAVVAAALLVLADAGPVVVEIGDWAAPVGINLVADRLSALMLTVSSVVILCVLIYSLAQGREDGERFAP